MFGNTCAATAAHGQAWASMPAIQIGLNKIVFNHYAMEQGLAYGQVLQVFCQKLIPLFIQFRVIGMKVDFERSNSSHKSGGFLLKSVTGHEEGKSTERGVISAPHGTAFPLTEGHPGLIGLTVELYPTEVEDIYVAPLWTARRFMSLELEKKLIEPNELHDAVVAARKVRKKKLPPMPAFVDKQMM